MTRRTMAMRPEHQFHLIALLVGFGVLMLLQSVLQAERVHQMPYREFKQAVAEGRVSEVTLTDTLIRGTMPSKDAQGQVEPRPFVVVRVADPDLVRELSAQKVKFTGTVQDTWLKSLFFIWILPIAVLWLIGRVMYKKMGPGQGMLSLGGWGGTGPRSTPRARSGCASATWRGWTRPRRSCRRSWSS